MVLLKRPQARAHPDKSASFHRPCTYYCERTNGYFENEETMPFLFAILNLVYGLIQEMSWH